MTSFTRLAVPVLATMLAGCAMPGYMAWKQDPFGSQVRENKVYWDGWRDGRKELRLSPDTVKAPSAQEQGRRPLSFNDLQPYMTDEELACNKMDMCWVNLERVENRRLHRNDKIVSGSIAQEQGRINMSARDVERIPKEIPRIDDPDFQAAADEAAKQTDAEFCAKATEVWQRRAFCHGGKP